MSELLATTRDAQKRKEKKAQLTMKEETKEGGKEGRKLKVKVVEGKRSTHLYAVRIALRFADRMGAT